MGGGCLDGMLVDNVSATGSGIHIEAAYCASKDDGDLLGVQLRESGSFIPVINDDT
jgi:hypothetical protein